MDGPYCLGCEAPGEISHRPDCVVKKVCHLFGVLLPEERGPSAEGGEQ